MGSNTVTLSLEEANALAVFRALSPDCQDALLALVKVFLKEQTECGDSME